MLNRHLVGRLAKIETLCKLFDFYIIIWKFLLRGFQNGVIFKICPSGSEDLSEMAPKKIFLKGFFTIFWE